MKRLFLMIGIVSLLLLSATIFPLLGQADLSQSPQAVFSALQGKDLSTLTAEDSIAFMKGQKIGISTGNIFEEIISDVLNGDYTSVISKDYLSLYSLLENGRVKAVIADKPIGDFSTVMHPEYFVLPSVAEENYGFMLKKGNPLVFELSKAIEQMIEEGRDEYYRKKWFVPDSSHVASEEFVIEEVKGTLRFSSDALNIPLCFSDYEGKTCGYEIDFVREAAARIGYKVELILSDFSGIIPAVMSGRADIGGGCISITAERQKSVDFTIPFYVGGIVPVTIKKEAEAFFSGSSVEEMGEIAVRDDTDASSPGFISSLKRGFTRTFIEDARYKLILRGLGVTIWVSLLSCLFGTIFGFLLCLMQLSSRKSLQVPAHAIVRTVQGLPVLVILLILFYVVFARTGLSGISVAVIAFSLNFGAYVSVMMYNGIEGVDKGQIEASRAMGFGAVETFCLITGPQAARRTLPVYKGEFISLVKSTSIVGYIAIQDLTMMGDIIRSKTYEAFFPLISVAVIYFAVSYFFINLIGLVEKGIDPSRRDRKVKGVKV